MKPADGTRTLSDLLAELQHRSCPDFDYCTEGAALLRPGVFTLLEFGLDRLRFARHADSAADVGEPVDQLPQLAAFAHELARFDVRFGDFGEEDFLPVLLIAASVVGDIKKPVQAFGAVRIALAAALIEQQLVGLGFPAVFGEHRGHVGAPARFVVHHEQQYTGLEFAQKEACVDAAFGGDDGHFTNGSRRHFRGGSLAL